MERLLLTSDSLSLLHFAQDVVVIAHSTFCNQSARLFPRLVVMARAYKAAGANLMFASADTFSMQYPLNWLRTEDGPKLFFLPLGAKTPEHLNGKMNVAAAISFINSKLPNTQLRIAVPKEAPETFSDPLPKTNDGPVKQIVADNFDELVLNSSKVRNAFGSLGESIAPVA